MIAESESQSNVLADYRAAVCLWIGFGKYFNMNSNWKLSIFSLNGKQIVDSLEINQSIKKLKAKKLSVVAGIRTLSAFSS